MPVPSLPIDLVSTIVETTNNMLHFEHLLHPGLCDFPARPSSPAAKTTLLALSRVSRLWRQASYPVLVRNIAFTTSPRWDAVIDTLFSFVAFAAQTWATAVRGLELTLVGGMDFSVCQLRDAHLVALIHLLPEATSLWLVGLDNLGGYPRFGAALHECKNQWKHLSVDGSRRGLSLVAFRGGLPLLRSLEIDFQGSITSSSWLQILSLPQLKTLTVRFAATREILASDGCLELLQKKALALEHLQLSGGHPDDLASARSLISANDGSLKSLSLHYKSLDETLGALVRSTCFPNLRHLHLCSCDDGQDMSAVAIAANLQAPRLESLSLVGSLPIYLRLVHLITSKRFPCLRLVVVGFGSGGRDLDDRDDNGVLFKETLMHLGVSLRFHPVYY